MAHIEIIKTLRGHGIRFPKAMKDEFKAAFPSATWKPASGIWEVGPRSLKRLESWVAAVDEQAKSISELEEFKEEAELISTEIERTRFQLAKVLSEIGDIEAFTKLACQSRVLLEQAKSDLSAALERKLAANKELQAHRDEVSALLAQAIDLPVVRRAVAVMARNHNWQGRDKFEEARLIVKNARSQLREAGFECRALNFAASANINRPDRDHCDKISDAHWFEVTPISSHAEEASPDA
jgi:hypothetical protein